MQRQQMHMLLDTLLDLGQAALRRHAMPAEAKGHFRAARREVLLGVRTLVDEAIRRTEEPEPAPAGPARIPIEDGAEDE